jgi:hypothetical protein
VPVAIILVAVVILVGIVAVAMGRGGELARPARDEPEETDFSSGADVASYRPPAALLGYEARATEHALQRISRTIADRDAEIAWLRLRLRELQPEGERRDGRLSGLSVPVRSERPGGPRPAAPPGSPAAQPASPGWPPGSPAGPPGLPTAQPEPPAQLELPADRTVSGQRELATEAALPGQPELPAEPALFGQEDAPEPSAQPDAVRQPEPPGQPDPGPEPALAADPVARPASASLAGEDG